MSQNNAQLSQEVSSKFQLKGIAYAGEVLFKGQHIDLSKISLEQAEKLAKDEGFPYLITKEVVTASARPEKLTDK